MSYSKGGKVVFVGSASNLLTEFLTLLSKNNETEVISSISFLSSLSLRFKPDLIVFCSVALADIVELKKMESFLHVNVLVVSKDFSVLNNLSGIADYSNVLICNECVCTNEAFINRLNKIIQKKEKILPSRTGSFVKYTIHFLNKNFSNALNLQKISEHSGKNEDYLSRIFKREMNLTVWNYLLILRMNLAKKFLIETDIPISQVAEKCGYSSLSYFDKAVVNYYGKTPGDVRQEV